VAKWSSNELALAFAIKPLLMIVLSRVNLQKILKGVLHAGKIGYYI